jgi:hypothetical protein
MKRSDTPNRFIPFQIPFHEDGACSTVEADSMMIGECSTVEADLKM